jgi:hypothetical protein
VARALGKREQALLERVLSQVAQRVSGALDQPPALSSDQLPGYEAAIVEVFGKVPPYQGRGRPPQQKQPTPQLCYGQVVKHREAGRVVAVTQQAILGRVDLPVSTSGVERTQLTSRQRNGRLVRKTLSFSKRRRMLEWACAWEDLVYNFAQPVKTLRVPALKRGRKWQERTPAMAAGLTDHAWTVRELAEFRVLQKGRLHSMG